jgi:repressor LexA
LLDNESKKQKTDSFDQDLFFFYVKDESMKNARILKGDWAMVQKQNNFNNGDIVLLTMHDNEPFIRKAFFKDHIVALIPENPDYEVQLANMLEVSILGKVIGVRFE